MKRLLNAENANECLDDIEELLSHAREFVLKWGISPDRTNIADFGTPEQKIRVARITAEMEAIGDLCEEDA